MNGSETVLLFLIVFFITVLTLGIQLLKGEGWDPISKFKPAILLCLPQERTWITNVICREVIFLVQWLEMIGDYSFCVYWWNCLPPMFKLTFHNVKTFILALHRMYVLTSRSSCMQYLSYMQNQVCVMKTQCWKGGLRTIQF